MEKLDSKSIVFGTWKLPQTNETVEIVKEAIEVGYRFLDTASAYQNEEFIGQGILKSNISRDEIFITGKLWNSDRDNVEKAYETTLKNLKVSYLDLYLMHWPASPAVYKDSEKINARVWREFEKLYKDKKVRAIGVCNFSIRQLQELEKTAEILPMVNQIEVHPGCFPKELISYCQSKNILVEAWSPLGHGKLLKKEPLLKLANSYSITVPELCLAWCLQNGVIPVVKSKNKERMLTNLKAMNIKIKKEDMEYLNNLEPMACSNLDSETITLFD